MRAARFVPFGDEVPDGVLVALAAAVMVVLLVIGYLSPQQPLQ